MIVSVRYLAGMLLVFLAAGHAANPFHKSLR